MTTALITGASRGFGFALGRALAARGWKLVVDGRDEASLMSALPELGSGAVAIPGDVADPDHRRALAAAADRIGGLDLLVNNASTLGATPLPAMDHYPLGELERVMQVNVLAPVALIQRLLPHLRAASGAVVNVTSDAAIEAYEGWGGYGASKAALDQVSAVLGAEENAVRVYAFDPGDMRTDMHQAAFPDEDISDRQLPDDVVPALLRVLDDALPSGRYRASDLAAPAGVSS